MSNGDLFLIVFAAGACFGWGLRDFWSLWRNTRKLEPKEGFTVVTRDGKQHYRRLPKADQVTE